MTEDEWSDKARRAPEPVFSFAEELAFQSFRSVFRTGLVDPAVLNAVMLSLAFAVNGESLNGECLGYRGQAIRHIRQKMNSMGEATSESTIGAILLLAGIEVCHLLYIVDFRPPLSRNALTLTIRSSRLGLE